MCSTKFHKKKPRIDVYDFILYYTLSRTNFLVHSIEQKTKMCSYKYVSFRIPPFTPVTTTELLKNCFFFSIENKKYSTFVLQISKTPKLISNLIPIFHLGTVQFFVGERIFRTGLAVPKITSYQTYV